MNSYDECMKKARSFFEGGRPDEAMTCYMEALHADPLRPDAYYEIGQALQFNGHPDAALGYYLKTLELNPRCAQAYANVGLIVKERGDMYEAIEYYKTAIMLNPDYADAYYRLGNAFNLIGKSDEAVAAYDKAAQYKPYHVIARWMRCMCQLPVIYTDPESILIHREQYRHELLALRDAISLDSPEDIAYAAEAVGSQQPFHLASQGLNDRELQRIYGELVCRIMSARYPQFSTRLQMPSLSSGEPIRVGIVSRYFHVHSVWKIPMKGWIENIDRKRFDLYGYCTGLKNDYVTENAKKHFTCFIEGTRSFEDLCWIIRKHNLHALIFPEIGMDPITQQLAALRLAAVQCTAMGHPDTTGLPTIDYYLSSDLMEPDDAESHYTERLVRLPKLSFSYEPPDAQPESVSRDIFGVRQHAVLYLCSHALFTHLPQYDEIYPRIARHVGDCQFLFISSYSDWLTERFLMRLQKAFEKHNVNVKNHIILLPTLNISRYLGVNRLSDVFLDTPGWSANNSTLEALAFDLPVVTCPGPLMRQRHCAGILKMMGLTEMITGSIDEYVDIAVRLGKNPVFRKSISEKIEKNKQLLYKDKTAIRGLEDFLIRAVTAAS
jgi:protein O-GlcNAc transferase